MKSFIVIAAALLAGCGSMDMRSSGSTGGAASSSSGTDYHEDASRQDRIFNSWVGS